jgi:quinol monooxygenase YgiN
MKSASLFNAIMMAGLIAAAPSMAAAAGNPPKIAKPANAAPVTVTLRLTAKDPALFKAHLLKVIPVTRKASGAKYSYSLQDPKNASEFLLIQSWDSIEQQQGYIAWREKSGDLAQFLGFLSKDPVIEVFALFDK